MLEVWQVKPVGRDLVIAVLMGKTCGSGTADYAGGAGPA
jgi:hypothetical protein